MTDDEKRAAAAEYMRSVLVRYSAGDCFLTTQRGNYYFSASDAIRAAYLHGLQDADRGNVK